jgi:DNA invertase Pin-like site-specific DNA recombinase
MGYAWVSSNHQDTSLPINELDASGCNTVFLHEVSGRKIGRLGLDEFLRTLRDDDTILVLRSDRIDRSMQPWSLQSLT